MDTGTLILMIIFLGFVWGGFIFTLRLAMKKNDEKKRVLEDIDG